MVHPVHPVVSGGMNDAKKCLMEFIEGCDIDQLEDKVFGDWRPAMEKIYGPVSGLKLPAVTVRISPARILQVHYARRIPEAGDMGIYAFTAHVFHKGCTEAGEEKYKYAQNLADRIMTYLLKRKWEDEVDCPICDVYDMQARESEPKRGSKSQRICRVIIEGFMLVKRVDS